MPDLTSRQQRSGLLRGLAEAAWSVSPWAPAPRPHRASEVTTSLIDRSFAVAGAQALSVVPLDGTTGTTDRRRLGITWNETGVHAGLPESVFIKSTPLSAKNRAMVGPLGMAVNEVRFYNQARSHLPDDMAPNSYLAHAGRGARHLMVLEDLLARDARCFSLSDEAGLEHLEGVVSSLAQLHAGYTDSARFSTDLQWIAPQGQRPGFALMNMAFRRVRRNLMKSDSIELSSVQARMCEYVNSHDAELYAAWGRGPQTLLHGDSHLGNTYRLAEGVSGLLDWQVIHIGPGLREVAYFLGSSAPVQTRRAHERDLIALYLDTLASAGGPVIAADVAWQAYRYFMFDTWDSTAITVLWPGLQTPEATHAAFTRACAAVDDLEVDQAVRTGLRQ